MFAQRMQCRRYYYAYPGGSDDDEKSAQESRHRQQRNPGEDLPYKVELWDTRGESVEVVLAVTASPSIGYAAFFAATREHPERQITLRHKNSIVSRWAGGTSH